MTHRALFPFAALMTLTLLVGCGTPVRPVPPAQSGSLLAMTSGTRLQGDSALYPRLIRLQNSGAANGRILASVVTFSGSDGVGSIFESTNGGASFYPVGSIRDPEAAANKGLCCGTLFELPRQVGNLSAGTLLWAASVGQDAPNRRMSQRIWTSTDQGRNWNYLSSCYAAVSSSGYWEPEFSVASDGALVCHFSDESDPNRSQRLVRARSYDGITWRDYSDTVSSNLSSDRPGMANVRKLPSGSYLMTYELCSSGGQYRCVVHARTSPDGWNWGTPSNLGVRIETPDGKYFKHAPTLALDGGGKLYLVGQVLNNRDGSVAAGNGRTVFTNSAGGSGTWQEITAPVQVVDPFDNYCPNYSSSLLPSSDGSTLLELATDYEGGACKTFFGSGTTAVGAVENETPAAVSWGSGRIDLFVRGADGALWQKSFSGSSWGGWSSLGGPIGSAPAAASSGANQLEVLVRGTDGALWRRSYGGGWGNWVSLGGIIATSPGATAGSGALNIFVGGTDGALWQRTPSSNWTSLGGIIGGTPSATSPGAGQLEVYVRGSDNALWKRSFNGSWSDWASLSGTLASSPAAIYRSSTASHVFVRGSDGALWQRWQDGGNSGWQSLGGTVRSTPAVASWGVNRLDVFARGDDGAVWWRSWNGSSWADWQSLGRP